MEDRDANGIRIRTKVTPRAAPTPPAGHAPSFALPMPGQTITSQVTGNTYSIGKQIGAGAFSVVYSATDEFKNDLVAKIILPRGASLQEVEKRTSTEVGMSRIVRHPHVVHTYDAFVFNGALYVILERCSLTLDRLIASPGFNAQEWIRPIARCLLQAIHATHAERVVHCDIHLGNIYCHLMPTEEPRQDAKAVTFKLGDFGLAKPIESVTAASTFHNAIRPPEAIDPAQFGAPDWRVDIYQAGLVLLQVLGGPRKFTQDDLIAGRPREFAAAVGGPLYAPLERMVRRRVSQRTTTALDAWKDFEAALG